MELIGTLKTIPMPILILAIIVLLVVTVYIGFQYLKQKGLDGIRGKVYELMLMAEHKYSENGAGLQKLKWVVQQARGLLPDWMRIFISEEMLTSIIDKWFKSVKDLLDDGKVNGSQ